MEVIDIAYTDSWVENALFVVFSPLMTVNRNNLIIDKPKNILVNDFIPIDALLIKHKKKILIFRKVPASEYKIFDYNSFIDLVSKYKKKIPKRVREAVIQTNDLSVLYCYLHGSFILEDSFEGMEVFNLFKLLFRTPYKTLYKEVRPYLNKKDLLLSSLITMFTRIKNEEYDNVNPQYYQILSMNKPYLPKFEKALRHYLASKMDIGDFLVFIKNLSVEAGG